MTYMGLFCKKLTQNALLVQANRKGKFLKNGELSVICTVTEEQICEVVNSIGFEFKGNLLPI